MRCPERAIATGVITTPKRRKRFSHRPFGRKLVVSAQRKRGTQLGLGSVLDSACERGWRLSFVCQFFCGFSRIQKSKRTSAGASIKEPNIKSISSALRPNNGMLPANRKSSRSGKPCSKFIPAAAVSCCFHIFLHLFMAHCKTSVNICVVKRPTARDS